MSAGRERARMAGERHGHPAMREARRRSIAAVRELARRIVPGISEESGLDLLRRTLHAHGFEREWSAPCLRFGVNTLKRFGEPSEPGVVLGRNDVWFVDIGPLWGNYECDFADTFAVGDDPERHRLVRDVHEVFDRTSRHWRESGATGAELYRYAGAEAAARGWQLDTGMAGHPIGEYPHGAIHHETLAQADFTPAPGIWMLEIQIRHPDLPFGAFFEDLLLDVADA
jgi:Xaa-Pro aminopeptidase